MNKNLMDYEKDFFSTLLKENRLLLVLYENLSSKIKNSELYSLIESYLIKYVKYNSISIQSVYKYYSNFIQLYNKHCKQFIKIKKYPFETGDNQIDISREEYDIVLILSVLLTPHRFRIMQLLYENNLLSIEKALFIGVGPGLELSLTKSNIKHVDSYDLSASDFIFFEYPDTNVYKELYTMQQQDYYNAIYMIELLEHVVNPYQLIKICYKSLKIGGNLFLTTATDIPQFDHLFNFPLNHTLFEEKIHQIGFLILKKEIIAHKYLTTELKSSNSFYILQKKFR